MRVEVGAVAETHGRVVATLITAVGTVGATWAPSSRPPVEGEELHVELDLDLVLDPATNTHRAAAGQPALVDHGDHVIIEATIEGIDDDGVAHLRLAPDGLVMVQTTGGVSVGDAVRIVAPAGALRATPFSGP